MTFEFELDEAFRDLQSEASAHRKFGWFAPLAKALFGEPHIPAILKFAEQEGELPD